jgi:hypothetical protein
MKKIVLISILMFSIIFPQCGTSSLGTYEQPYKYITDRYISSVDSLVFLERTPCFGHCPAYRLSFQSNGTILFEGSSYTERPGLNKGYVTTDNYQALIHQILSSGFLSLKNKYDYNSPDCKESWTDASASIIMLKVGKQKKSVYYYHGCLGFQGDSVLYAIEGAIDSLTNSKQ